MLTEGERRTIAGRERVSKRRDGSYDNENTRCDEHEGKRDILERPKRRRVRGRFQIVFNGRLRWQLGRLRQRKEGVGWFLGERGVGPVLEGGRTGSSTQNKRRGAGGRGS